MTRLGVLVAAALALAGCADAGVVAPTSYHALAVGTRCDPATTVTVTVKNFSFTPANVTIQAGTTVVWKFDDGNVPHTTTSDGGSTMTWDSGFQYAGGTYSQTFTQPGTYKYHCRVHPRMMGSVTVIVN